MALTGNILPVYYCLFFISAIIYFFEYKDLLLYFTLRFHSYLGDLNCCCKTRDVFAVPLLLKWYLNCAKIFLPLVLKREQELLFGDSAAISAIFIAQQNHGAIGVPLQSNGMTNTSCVLESRAESWQFHPQFK